MEIEIKDLNQLIEFLQELQHTRIELNEINSWVDVADEIIELSTDLANIHFIKNQFEKESKRGILKKYESISDNILQNRNYIEEGIITKNIENRTSEYTPLIIDFIF